MSDVRAATAAVITGTAAHGGNTEIEEMRRELTYSREKYISLSRGRRPALRQPSYKKLCY